MPTVLTPEPTKQVGTLGTMLVQLTAFGTFLARATSSEKRGRHTFNRLLVSEPAMKNANHFANDPNQPERQMSVREWQEYKSCWGSAGQVPVTVSPLASPAKSLPRTESGAATLGSPSEEAPE